MLKGLMLALCLILGATAVFADAGEDCYKANGDVGIAGCTELIRRNPSNAVAYYNRGNNHAGKKEHHRAIADYTKAIEINPKLASAYYNRAIGYRNRAHANPRDYDPAIANDLAIADFTKAIELEPDAKRYNHRGWVYQDKKDHDRAIADFTKALELEPRDALTYSARGESWEAKGNKARAIADYREALSIFPNDRKIKDALKRLGETIPVSAEEVCYFKLDDTVIAGCSEVIQQNPKDAKAHFERGNAYQKKSDYDHALSDYNKAIDLDAKNFRYYSARAAVYTEKKDPDRAIADYTKAIDLNPVDNSAIGSKDTARLLAAMDKEHAYLGRGLAHQTMGDKARAIADYRRAHAFGGSPFAARFLKLLGETP